MGKESMNNVQRVTVESLATGDIIDCGHEEVVISVTPSTEYTGRCSLKTNKCSIACNLDSEVFKVVK